MGYPLLILRFDYGFSYKPLSLNFKAFPIKLKYICSVFLDFSAGKEHLLYKEVEAGIGKPCSR
jgi:hypothetical protein